MEAQIENEVSFHGPFGILGHIQGNSILQCWFQSEERRILKTYYKSQYPLLCSTWWTTYCIHQKLQRSSGSMKCFWQNLWNKEIVQHSIRFPKLFTYKMQEDGSLLHNITKAKALTKNLACLETPVRNEDVAMTLFKCLQLSYEHLIPLWRQCWWRNSLWNKWWYVWCTRWRRRNSRPWCCNGVA